MPLQLGFTAEKSTFEAFLFVNHKKYNFLDCDYFKTLLFPTHSLVKLLSDSLLSNCSISQSNSKVQLKLTDHIERCSLNQPITTLVLITIETSVLLIIWGFSLKWRIFPLSNDYIVKDSDDFFYPYGTNFYAKYLDEFLCVYVAMFR